MTHLKKSLALLLALIMMFSSMSVAANAAGSTGTETTEDDITFTVKFFREKDGEWIETTKAAPGEKVKARVFVETGFYANTSDSCILFDNQYFTPFKYNAAGVEESLQALVPNELSANKSYGDVNYAMTGTYTWRGNDTTWQKNIDFILEEIENDPNYFDTRDIISHTLTFPALAKNLKLTASDWICEFDFWVNNTPLTNTIDSKGETEVPPYYASFDRTVEHPKYGEVNAELFINFPMGEEGGDLYSEQVSMKDWIPDFDTVPGTITTTSEIIFDMGLVDETGAWAEDTYTTEKGIIGKEADLDSITNPTHPEGKVFSHWSLTKPGNGVTQEKVSAISYDYDAVTLYAVWSEPSDVNYILNEYYMKADGTYPATVQGTQKEAAPNSTVSAPESTDPLFILDKENSDFDVVVNADGSSVVNAYYERVKYNLVYHYEDMAGAQTDSYKVRFGADLPGFRTTKLDDGTIVEGEPTKTGYTFVGWTTTEGGTEAETRPDVMPTEDLHFYPVYVPGETYEFVYIFNAGEGTFSNGESIMRYEYNYLDPTETPEAPTAPGKRFVDWDDEIPAVAAEDKTFEAIYEDELYTVTFMADADEDEEGTYETTVAILSEKFKYGDKLEAKYAPENYPADAWKLEDGTAVEISDAETAYTVTGNVVLYTVGNDEYPANFYLSQEDLDNGADPYKTIYVKFDTEIPAPEVPENEKPGYNFIVWEPDVESGLIMDSTEGKDFVAIFEAKDITVTYDPNNGECDVPSATVKYENSVTLPEATRDGYEFKGWATPDGTNVGTAGGSYKVPTENITLKAVWEAEEHTITFIDTDGKELGKITADTDEDITVPENLNPPVKEGYEFTGWTSAGAPATVPAKMPAEDMILTASWNKLSYAINADANGGTFSDGEATYSAEVPYGDALNVEQPTWAGHEFKGWAYADDESNTIITLPKEMPAKAISIKAVWDTNVHNVYYDANGGVFTNADGSTTSFREIPDIEYGAQIPVLEEEPTKEGYTFEGWTPAAPDAMPDNDFTFRAVWEKIPDPTEAVYEIYVSYPNPADPTDIIEKLVITDSALPGTTVAVIKDGELTFPEIKAHTYDEIIANLDVDYIEPDYNNRPAPMTVTENGGKIVVPFELTVYTVEFSPNGGMFGTSGDSVIKTGTWGQTVEAPAQPTRQGYTFTGWNKDVPETFTEDVVISATWEIQKHNAIFIVVDENGEEVTRIPVEFEYGATITAPAYDAPAGYEFNGWDIPAGTTMGETDIPFTSVLEPITYELSYEISGLPADKNVTAPATQTGLRANKEADVAKAPVVAGYTFDGWYYGEEKIAADGNGKIEMPADDVVLTGTYKAVKYTLSFNPDNGETIESVEYDCDQVIDTLPTVTKDGYNFLGWFNGEEKYVAGTTKMPAEDVTLVAKWSQDSFGVTANANGGTFSNGDAVYNADVAYGDELEIEEPTWAGHKFLGWAEADDETNTIITLPDEMPAEEINVKAVWETNKHTVTYNANGGVFAEGVESVFTVEYGKEIPVPSENPTKEGFSFVRWTPATLDAMPDNDLEFIAEWKEVAPSEATYEIYAVTYNPANPTEKIEVLVGEGSGVVGETVEILMDGEEKTADHAHTYAELIAKLASSSNEPDYDNRPEATTLGEGANKILVEFKLIEFTVTFDANGGTIDDENGVAQPEIVEKGYYGQPITIPGDDALYLEGYEFAGWDKTPAETFTENATYTATWTAGLYDAYFYVVNENGEEVLYKVESFEFGAEIVAPEYTAPAGYEFSGWDVDGKTMGADDESFTATLIPIDYKLTYVINGLPADKGVSAPAEVTGLHAGQDVDVEAAPAVPGYTFDGWYDADGGKYFDNGTDTLNMPAKNVILAGTYTAQNFTITYISNGAGDVPSATYACDATVTLPEVSREGYTFDGWYDGEVKVESGFKMPARDITLTAKWSEVIVESTITFDANGGTFSNGESEYTVSGVVDAPVTAPAAPTKTGFEFIGWVDANGDATSVPEVFPAEDITITAAWAELYDVTYYEEDGVTVIKTFVDAGKEGANIPAIADPVKEGFRFTGWEGMPEDGKIPAGNLKLVATFEEIIVPKYTITYVSNGVTVYTAAYEENEPIEEYNLNNVEGYTFKGWNPELPDNMPANDLTVEAVWEINEHDITLDANGGKFEDGTAVFADTFAYGTVLSDKIPAQPTREGYEFMGWDGELPSTMPDSDVSLKAVWEAKEYTITFDSNGGSDVPSQTYKFGETVTAPAAPTREGFKFIKWSPELPLTMPAENITVVAQWEAVVVTKTLIIDANGGAFEDGTSVKTETLAVGEEIKNLPVPTRDGFVFDGWAGIPEDGKMPATDLTIKATWSPVAIPEHKVEYYYAVDGALYQTLTFAEGEAIVHPAGPSVEGLTFTGWADENGNALPEVMGNEDLKAYAQYEFNTYKVTYIVDGGVYQEYEVLYQAEVPVPADPADSATRLFAGWDPTPVSTMPAHDLTYTATWVGAPEPDEYTATFLRHNGETHAKYVLEEGDVIPVPVAPQRFGYVFVGWEPSVPDTMPAHDMVFEPKYEVDKTFVTIVIGGTVVAGGVIAGSIIGANIAAITGVSIVGGILVIVGVAELIKHTHTVTYIVDGEVYKTYKVVEGTKIPVPADPVKDGFTFEGWNPEVPKKMGDKDLVFEATWAEKAADDSSPDVDVEIPDTGSVAGGLTAFAVISGAAAAAYAITRRKKED